MIERKTLISSLGGVVVGGLLLSGGWAFASSTTNASADTTGQPPFEHRGGGPRGGGMGGLFMGGERLNLSQENLAELVSAGVITQDKATAISDFITAQKESAQTDTTQTNAKPPARLDLSTALVKNNILTQTEVDTISAKLKELAQQKQQEELTATLKTLVDKGTLTQDQADKIVAQSASAEQSRETLREKMESMTLKEIREYFQTNQEKPQNPMEQLVTDKVITQEQADAIRQAQAEARQTQEKQRQSDSLKALVEKGTITQDQADKILAAIDSIEESRQAVMEKTKTMTKEERRQYLEENKTSLQDPLSQLQTDGVITQTQAEAVRGEMHFGPGGHR